MSEWIKFQKSLLTDSRVRRIAKKIALRLRNGDVAQKRDEVTQERDLRDAEVTLARCTVLGALATLWFMGDDRIAEDDVLAVSTDEIDEAVGIEGFCQFLPTDWLQVLDANHVKLVDYTDHNGPAAKQRALSAKRQQRHRSKNKSSKNTRQSRTRNATPSRKRYQKEEKEKKEEIEEKRRDSPDLPLAESSSHHSGVSENTRARVIDCGTGLLSDPAVLDGWRRDVPEANAEKFVAWVVSVEEQGKMLRADQRLHWARYLAMQGTCAEQAEIVDWCVAKRYKSLIPLADVRRQRDGFGRAATAAKPRWHPPDYDPEKASDPPETEAKH